MGFRENKNYANEGKILGKAIWAFGDYMSFLLSRSLLTPTRSKI